MKLIAHLMLLNVIWWATILSAVHVPQFPWLPGIWIVVMIALALTRKLYKPGDLLAGCALLAIGLVLDTIWIQLGWINHQVAWPFAGFCPLWLATLWFTVGVDFRMSLGWAHRRWLIGILATGLSGPSSYWGGAALGVAIIPTSTAWAFALGLFITWAIIFPLFSAGIAYYETRFGDPNGKVSSFEKH